MKRDLELLESYWPSPVQEALLRLAIGGVGSESAHAVLSPVDLSSLDYASKCLLPAIFRRNRIDSLAPGVRRRLKSVYQWSWYRNQLILAGARRAISELHAEGIDTLLLKGLPLSLLYYQDLGQRPMGDCDLMVPYEKRFLAGELLQNAGWQPVEGHWRSLMEVRHALSFRDASGHNIDLHWHLLRGHLRQDWDEPLWANSRPIGLGGLDSRTLCAEHHLLQAVYHGIWRSANTSPVHWVVDAASILEVDRGTLNWNRFIEGAAERKVQYLMYRGLAYLSSLGVEVPAAVLERLSQSRLTRLQRVEFWALDRSSERSPLGYLPLGLSEYLIWCRTREQAPGLASFDRWARAVRGIDSRTGLLLAAVKWPFRRALRMVRALALRPQLFI